MYNKKKGFLDQYTRVLWVQFSNMNICNVWRARDDGHHYDVTSKCCGVTITTRLVEWTLSISEVNVFFCCFQKLSGLKNTSCYPTKVWDKSKTTWEVGIAQLTHHPVRGGGKIMDTGLGIFAPHLELRGELIAQYRPPMSFRYKSS